jgi:hypothetical protein
MTKERVLAALAAYGKQLGAICGPQSYKADTIRAACHDMTLGTARAAYKAILNGRPVLTVLHELAESADFYGLDGMPVYRLIARYELETDTTF